MTAAPNFRRLDAAEGLLDQAMIRKDSQPFASRETRASASDSRDSQDSQQRLPKLPLQQALARAEALLKPEPRGPESEYPIEALGPLADAAQSLAASAQLAPALAGQSMLAAAALLGQSLANVQSLDGSPKPLSLFALSVLLSGDGKDTADRVAFKPVTDFQREAAREYAALVAEQQRELAGRKKGDEASAGTPTAPFRIVADATIEGLRRSFLEGVSSQGVFSTEAGAILAGHAMSPDHRVKTAASLCGLWDRGHFSVARAGAPRVEMYDRRLSAHLMVQPAALGDVLADEGLSNIGLWPRFLMAWPAPLPPRLYRPWAPASCPAITAYWQRCSELLAHPVPAECHDLPVLQFEQAAMPGLARFFELMEREAKRGELRSVRPFALRAPETACRIAGVLAVFGGHRNIDEETAKNACLLAAHSVESWRTALTDRTDPVPGWALTLWHWLAQRPEGVPLRDIPRTGPAQVRPAARRDAALDLLRSVGLIDVNAGGAIAMGVDHAD